MLTLIPLPLIMIWLFVVARRVDRSGVAWALIGGGVYYAITALVGALGLLTLDVFFPSLGQSDGELILAVGTVAAVSILLGFGGVFWMRRAYVVPALAERAVRPVGDEDPVPPSGDPGAGQSEDQPDASIQSGVAVSSERLPEARRLRWVLWLAIVAVLMYVGYAVFLSVRAEGW